jgi:PPOX class probable F420-dependent enzyme
MTDDQVAFLLAQRVAHFATVDDAGQPHVVPICFACIDGVLYTAVDQKPKRGDPLGLRRVRNLVAHPDVCVVADHYEDNWSRLEWLQVRGRASLVTDGNERNAAVAALRGRYSQYRTMDLESRPLIRVVPTAVVGWSAAAARE